MTDDEFLETVVSACQRLPNAEAVNPGGLEYANYWAVSSNPINCAGPLSKILLQGAHARLAHGAIWTLNEKRMVEWADLTNLYGRFSSLGRTEHDLTIAIQEVRASISEIEGEVSDEQ